MQHSLQQVVVVPRNGYLNRLQAWASSAILAAELDVPLAVAWEPEAVAPASPGDLFSHALIARSFWGRERIGELVGRPHEQVPRYLTQDSGLIVLAGHDRGEQVFMGELAAMLLTLDRPTTLVIVAGGKFHLPRETAFSVRRSVFYRNLSWRPELDERVEIERGNRTDYVALHVRGTDRSIEAPTAGAIRRGLRRLFESTEVRSLFIAADTAVSRERWSEVASGIGFSPWFAKSVNHDRTHADAGRDAMLDWRLLGGAAALVYPSASSFGEEAAVLTGNVQDCVPLAAGPLRQRFRGIRQVARAVVTYPVRHGSKEVKE